MSPPATIEHVTAPDGVRLALHVLGEGPPLLCLPGGPGRASEYLEDLAGLAGHRTLLRLDSRGTGLSDLPEDPASLAFPQLAEDVETVREARGLDRVDLLGHSAGSLVAMLYAVRHPRRVARLVLVTPSGHAFGEVADDVAAIRASRSDEPWYAEAVALEREIADLPPQRRAKFDRDLRMFTYGRWDARAQEHAAGTDTQMSMRATAAFAPPGLRDQLDGELRAGLARLPVPALVVVGDKDGLTGARAGHLVAAALSDARVAEISGAGHYPWVDEPERFRETVLAFLAS